MMKKTHLSVGVAVTIFLSNTGLFSPLSFLGLFGSLAPDWDFKLHIRHRTYTHSLFFLFLSSYLLYKLDLTLGIVWFSNYLLHLIFDSLTIRGIPWLYPICKKRYGFKLFKTGGPFDFLFFLISISIIIIQVNPILLSYIRSAFLTMKKSLRF